MTFLNRFEDFGITGYDKGHKDEQGNVYVPCPQCGPSRKHHAKNTPSLSVNVIRGVFNCHHCGFKGNLISSDWQDNNKVKPLNFTGTIDFNLKKNLIRWFKEKRGISHSTLIRCRIGMTSKVILQLRNSDPTLIGKWMKKSVIAFNYYLDGQLVDIKYRDSEKNFGKEKGADLIFYGMDDIRDETECFIVEGEMDKLAFAEAGIMNVLSVPNGSVISEKERQEYLKVGVAAFKPMNLKYLDNCIEKLDKIKSFYLITDDDLPGIKLREELARRLGKENCYFIQCKKLGCKDANEILLKHGPDVLKNIKDYADAFPISNVLTAKSIADKISSLYTFGMDKGLSTGFVSVNEHFRMRRGHLIVVNGRQGMGKSSFVFYLAIYTAWKYNWKWAIYSIESFPAENVFRQLAEIFIGKSFDKDVANRMSRYELDIAMNFLDNHFYLIDESHENLYTPDELRNITIKLIKKHGIQGVIKDPWNSLVKQYKSGESYNDWLQRQLTAEVAMSTQHSIVNLICAHPITLRNANKDGIFPAPTIYDLEGGQMWANKVYDAICIDRFDPSSYSNTEVALHVQKIKFQDLCGRPTKPDYPIKLYFDRYTKRYKEELKGTRYCPLQKLKLPSQQTGLFEDNILDDEEIEEKKDEIIYNSNREAPF